MSSGFTLGRWSLLLFFCATGGAAVASCGGGPVRSLPAPQYERPELPPWEPPSRPAEGLDAGSLEGEWVDDGPESGHDSGPARENPGSGGAGGAPAVVERAGPA